MKTFVLFLVGCLTVASGACNRTPSEPSPEPNVSRPLAASVSAATAPAPARAPGKCVAPMPPPRSLPAAVLGARCPEDPASPRALQKGQVSFPDAPGSPSVRVELARSAPEIERGLMYRRSLPQDQGMWFSLDEVREHVFWMRNTCIPLDMMFIDPDGTIVGIVEGAEPLTESARTVRCPSRYVLEVNAGWARAHGVVPGQKVAIPLAAY